MERNDSCQKEKTISGVDFPGCFLYILPSFAQTHKETVMSWKCDICGKKPSVGYRVSHSTRHTKHIWKPNLQAARVLINGVATKNPAPAQPASKAAG